MENARLGNSRRLKRDRVEWAVEKPVQCADLQMELCIVFDLGRNSPHHLIDAPHSRARLTGGRERNRCKLISANMQRYVRKIKRLGRDLNGTVKALFHTITKSRTWLIFRLQILFLIVTLHLFYLNKKLKIL